MKCISGRLRSLVLITEISIQMPQFFCSFHCCFSESSGIYTYCAQLFREDIFLISKLHPANHGTKNVGRSIEETLSNLGVEYLDLFLVHWPGIHRRSVSDFRNQKAREESWSELEKFYG